MDSTFRVLAVCTGNVHRSALAEAMLKLWAGWYLPSAVSARVQVSSAGTAAARGASMTSRVVTIAQALGVQSVAHTASQLTDDDVAEADLVLVASRAHRDEVLARVPSALRRTFTIREAGRVAVRLPGDRIPQTVTELQHVVAAMAETRFAVGANAEEDDVIDPQGRGDEAYSRMAREEVPPLAAVARVLFGMPPADVEAYRSAVQRENLIIEGSA